MNPISPNIIDEKKHIQINLLERSAHKKIEIVILLKIKTKKEQQKIIILGDMKELGENSLNYHIELLEYIVKKKLSNVIICGELLKIALDKICNKNILNMDDIDSILEYAKKNLKNNDIVLIKGSNSSLTRNLALKLLKR